MFQIKVYDGDNSNALCTDEDKYAEVCKAGKNGDWVFHMKGIWQKATGLGLDIVPLQVRAWSKPYTFTSWIGGDGSSSSTAPKRKRDDTDEPSSTAARQCTTTDECAEGPR